MTELKQYSPGAFWNKVMSAVAMAIVVSVTPSAINASMLMALLAKRPARSSPLRARASVYMGTSVEVMQELSSNTGM